MDLIFIEGFKGETVIGIHETELHRPQPLVIDVHAGLDSTFDVLAVHWNPAVNIANKDDHRGRNDGRLYTRLK